MLLIWYLWADMYNWIPISLVVVKVWTVRCPSVKGFLLLCWDNSLTCLILLLIYPFFLLPGPWLAGMLYLAAILSERCFHFLVLTRYPGCFCHLHLCHGLSFDLSIMFVSFKLAFLFLDVLSAATKISNLRVKTVIHFPALFSETFSWYVGCCLAEVGTYEVQTSIFIYHRLNGCKSTIYSWLGWFPWFLRRVCKFVFTMPMVVSKCHSPNPLREITSTPACMYVWISALYSLDLTSCMYISMLMHVSVLYIVSISRHVCVDVGMCM